MARLSLPSLAACLLTALAWAGEKTREEQTDAQLLETLDVLAERAGSLRAEAWKTWHAARTGGPGEAAARARESYRNAALRLAVSSDESARSDCEEAARCLGETQKDHEALADLARAEARAEALLSECDTLCSAAAADRRDLIDSARVLEERLAGLESDLAQARSRRERIDTTAGSDPARRAVQTAYLDRLLADAQASLESACASRETLREAASRLSGGKAPALDAIASTLDHVSTQARRLRLLREDVRRWQGSVIRLRESPIVLALRGNIQRQRSFSCEPLSQPGATLLPGDSLRTDDGAWALLEMEDGSVVELGPGSTLEIPYDASTPAAVTLHAGSARVTGALPLRTPHAGPFQASAEIHLSVTGAATTLTLPAGGSASCGLPDGRRTTAGEDRASGGKERQAAFPGDGNAREVPDGTFRGLCEELDSEPGR